MLDSNVQPECFMCVDAATANATDTEAEQEALGMCHACGASAAPSDCFSCLSGFNLTIDVLPACVGCATLAESATSCYFCLSNSPSPTLCPACSWTPYLETCHVCLTAGMHDDEPVNCMIGGGRPRRGGERPMGRKGGGVATRGWMSAVWKTVVGCVMCGRDRGGEVGSHGWMCDVWKMERPWRG
eukprot:356902-Chlamydomonas_euryale.AAC.20